MDILIASDEGNKLVNNTPSSKTKIDSQINNLNNIPQNKLENQKTSVKQEQLHSILFSREIGWQEIIYDLINTEQLDPWDINIVILADGFLAKIESLEEADFFISGKVLLAAALLLRIKSEFLLNKYIKSIDEILFGKKELPKSSFERIELDEEIPELIPKTPMPRFKRVTLKELMESLNKAIITENRRIKKHIIDKNALRETAVVMPKRKYNIREKIKEIYAKLFGRLKEDKEKVKVSYSELIGSSREERLISFYPLLQLENQERIWLEQKQHFDEIYIWLRHTYLRHNPDPIEEIKKELELKELELQKDKTKKKRLDKLNKDFENPMKELLE